MDMHLWIWKPTYMIRRFADDAALARDDPYSVSVFSNNVLLRQGRHAMQTLITGGSLSSGGSLCHPFDNTHAYLGVGNSSTLADESQEGIQGASTKYKPMDTGFPIVTGTVATYRSTFGANDANFDWEEFSMSNTPGNGGFNMFRKVSSQSTKVAGQSWELTIAVDLTSGGSLS